MSHPRAVSSQPILGRLCGVNQIPPSAPNLAFGQKGATRSSTDQAFKEIFLKVTDDLRAALGANSEAPPVHPETVEAPTALIPDSS